MINEKDVITMKIPFPEVSSHLAVQKHMYVCMGNRERKSFAKCQTLKPRHLMAHTEPRVYVVEEADLSRNPFLHKTIVDCDKVFEIENVIIDPKMLTHRRKDICDSLYQTIKNMTSHDRLKSFLLDQSQILQLNQRITKA